MGASRPAARMVLGGILALLAAGLAAAPLDFYWPLRLMGSMFLVALLAGMTWHVRQRQRALHQLVHTLETLQPDAEPSTLLDELLELDRALRRAFQRHRARLHEQQSRLRALQTVLDYMRDGILLVSAAGRIVDLNPAAEALLDIRAEQARGRTLAQGVAHHRLVALWQQCHRSGREQRDVFEIPATGRLIQVIATPLGAKDMHGVLLLIQDLTRLHHLETVRRDFVANLSHELRTPLAALQALIETLQASALKDPDAAHAFLQRMQEEVSTLNRLVEDLLELARLESGRLSLHLASQSPYQLLQQAAKRIAWAAQKADIHVELRASPDLPSVFADRLRILQVLANLLDNALRFTPAGGTIILGASAMNDEVCFWVQDTGPGIPPEHQHRIFERFYKVDPARGGKGAGLGLAIARHIIEAHQGRIGVESRPGRGSRFWFTLPRSP